MIEERKNGVFINMASIMEPVIWENALDFYSFSDTNILTQLNLSNCNSLETVDFSET